METFALESDSAAASVMPASATPVSSICFLPSSSLCFSSCCMPSSTLMETFALESDSAAASVMPASATPVSSICFLSSNGTFGKTPLDPRMDGINFQRFSNISPSSTNCAGIQVEVFGGLPAFALAAPLALELELVLLVLSVISCSVLGNKKRVCRSSLPGGPRKQPRVTHRQRGTLPQMPSQRLQTVIGYRLSKLTAIWLCKQVHRYDTALFHHGLCVKCRRAR